jgi:parallel beta-helix repeat protein
MQENNIPVYYLTTCILLFLIIFSNLSDIGQSAQFFNDIYFVGGSGAGNYSSIQSAINAATENSIVYVFDESAPYHEHIIIDKKLTLTGERRNTTIIDGDGYGDVISVYAEQVIIHGFTIQHSGPTSLIDSGIELHADTCIIFDNCIRDNPGFSVGIYAHNSSFHKFYENSISNIGNEGILIQNSNDNKIYRNTISQCGHVAIVTDASQDNIIEYNTMYENYASMSLWPHSIKNEIRYNMMQNSTYSGMGIWPSSNKNYIHHNHILNSEERGILVKEADGNRIVSNIFENCDLGIFLNNSIGSIIYSNNFIENTDNAGFYDTRITFWLRNYWDDHETIWPKRIKGQIHLPWEPTILIDWTNYDFIPARKPYQIDISEDR